MSKELSNKAKEIGRRVILKWCKDTFEGEMLEILKNSCGICAVRELTSSMKDPINELSLINDAAKSVVEETIKEYISNSF